MASAPLSTRGNLVFAASIAVLCNMMRAEKKIYLGEKKNTFHYIFLHIFHWPVFPGEATLSAWLDGYEGCLLVNDNGSTRIAPWISCIIKKCQLCLYVYIPRPCDRLSTETCHAPLQARYEMTRQRKLRNKILWIKKITKKDMCFSVDRHAGNLMCILQN